MIRSVLNLCVALRHPAKIETLRIYCVGSTLPELLLEVHTLTRNETYQLLCGSRAETHSMCVWQNLGVSEHHFFGVFVQI